MNVSYDGWGGGHGEEEGPWTEVHYNKQRKNRGNGVEMTFIVQNLPERTTRTLLRKSFMPFGFVSDAYVARKKDKKGNCFGFIRYVGVEDVDATVAEMNMVKILEAKVSVSLAKYDKNHKKFIYTSKIVGGKTWRPKDPPNMAPPVNYGTSSGGAAVQSSKTFASLFQKESQEINTGTKVISIKFKGSSYPVHCMNRSIHGVVKDLYVLNNLNSILSRSGLSNFGLSYVGGLNVLLTLGSPERVKEVMSDKSESLSKAFSSFNVWKGEDLPSERIVSIRISGVPVHLRDSTVYDQIGGLFGKVVQESNFSWMESNNSECSMLVLAPLGKRIEEAVVLNWEERRFVAWVIEDEPWERSDAGSDGEQNEEGSGASSDGDTSEEGDNMEDDTEEGEIKSPAANVPVPENIVRSTSAAQVGHEESPDNEPLGNLESLHAVHGEIKSPSNFNKVNTCTLNVAATTSNSGPQQLVEKENDYLDNVNQYGPTPITGLGKRNRDVRSPPSTDSMVGPPTRGFF
ncbi:putative RNA recognition motif domain, nucleotide-binding alpha-beta plait domain superfamily [Helianthus debilis subsp. tardiflorus]